MFILIIRRELTLVYNNYYNDFNKLTSTNLTKYNKKVKENIKEKKKRKRSKTPSSNQ